MSATIPLPQLTLHRCPKLSAWITVAQCARLAKETTRWLATKEGRYAKSLGVSVPTRPCLGCPGVVALDAGTRDLPELRVICNPRKRRKMKSPPTGLGKSIGIAAAKRDWSCPAHLCSVSSLARELHMHPAVVKRKLDRLEPAEVPDPRIGKPALYRRDQAEEVLR